MVMLQKWSLMEGEWRGIHHIREVANLMEGEYFMLRRWPV